MAAAARNLTPVTLELGGKSPAIVCADFPLEQAAARIATGKWFNGGQTCIAPDYVLVDDARREALAQALQRELAARYGTGNDSDYTRIVNDAQYARLQRWLDEAQAQGARVLRVGESDPAARRFAPALVLDAGEETALMREEIFGPVLPIRGYAALDEAIGYVNAHDRPLALYPFSRDRDVVERIVRGTLAGGVTVNDTLIHFGINALPFGGIGASGMGAYHGRAGFDAFSKQLPIVWQARRAGSDMLKPPYAKVDRFIRMLVR
jgi:coniferyl-aldehyde dehydrogenase